jgi:surface polysaccharide O-acyltransferase-like enzyme
MKNKVFWVDFIRITASFSVVLLHSAAPLLEQYKNISAFDWWTGNVYDSMVRSCVPLFFILSGYLLLGKQEPIKEFFIKRINKILLPFIVWSCIYNIWAHFFYNKDLSLNSFLGMVFAPTFFHLWFFYVIIGLYLFIPVLRYVIQASPTNILYYYIALWFLAVSVIPFVEKVTHHISIIDFKMISGFVGYLVIGHLLGTVPINRRLFLQALALAFLCLLVTIFGTYFLMIRHHGEFDGYFYAYLSPNIVLFSSSSFIVLRYWFEKLTISENQKKVITAVSSASLGIYLIHPMFLYALEKGWLGFSLNGFVTLPVYTIPLTAVIAFGLSLVVIYFLQKIPFIRNCVP